MPDHNPTLSAAARERFPRGLVQPASGFRFSVDALLLASFARIKGARGLDLGCGCGVVGLGLLLRHPERGFTMHGLDLNPDMVAAARSNAALLGFGERYTAELADLGDLGDVTDPAVVPAEIGPALAPESFDLVVSNPPYRRPGQGRDCPDPGKSLGRFESGAGLPDFTRAAGRLLRNRGRAAFVFPAERLADLLLALRESRLEPKIMRLVHSRAKEAARLVLVGAVKNAAPGLGVQAPLVLYGQGAASRELSPEALAFCPFLGCNPVRE